MKKIIYFLILTSFSFFAQKKEKIVFLFDQNKDSIILKNNYRIYTIGNNETFKHSIKKHKEINVTYESIKKHVISPHDFLKKNKFKKNPNYYNEYIFYIFIRKNYKYGCLVEVEKIWLVESKIAD
jgi:hypothetical protein